MTTISNRKHADRALRVSDFLEDFDRVTEAANRNERAEARVACEGCQACCWHPGVFVYRERERPEDLERMGLKTDEHGNLYIPKREDGGCIHLTDKGCGIYESRPEVCRGFDCRLHAFTGARHSDFRIPFWEINPRTDEELFVAIFARSFAKQLDEALDDMDAAAIGGIELARAVSPVIMEALAELTEQERRHIVATNRREFGKYLKAARLDHKRGTARPDAAEYDLGFLSEIDLALIRHVIDPLLARIDDGSWELLPTAA